MIKGERFVVTGGAGFIGSNLVLELIKNGNEVIVVDDLSTGNIENISQILPEITFVNGDIRDIELLKETFQNVDCVIHCAALASVPKSVEDPIAANQINIDGTLNVLVAARDADVKRVVYAASSAAYGNSPILPKTEDMKPEPLTPYAITKLVGEQYCNVFYELYGLETVSLRYFNVFGPRQDPKSEYAAVIPKFIAGMLKNERPIIYGDGEQSRDFTYVQNNVDATLLACEVKAAAGELFNIACGEMITLNELVEKLNLILDKNIEPTYTNPQLGDVKHSMADISLTKKILGFEPKYDFEYGLRKTIDWFKKE
ncbi:MAG: SDR family oxidoreductase [Candidatus Heimdallarchaeota archaeon]|nr:SDR family oxidoreductase [Candidatus Heimdallarchaeota archaeon]